MTINVLYIDGVAPFGGASRSLCEVLRVLVSADVNPYFLTVSGTAFDAYALLARDYVLSVGIARFDNTQYSHYRGLRWLVCIREITFIPFTVFSILAAYFKWRATIDIIHVNEITEILPALFAKLLFKVPLVVHVRSPQWANHSSLRSRLLHYLLKRHVDCVIAINNTTRSTLPPDLGVTVIQNSFDASKRGRPDLSFRDRLEALPASSFRVGFVGNIIVSKGIFDLFDAALLLHRSGIDIQFLIVGGHTRPANSPFSRLLKLTGLDQNVFADLQVRIASHGLADSFHLLGPTSDIHSVYESMDVIAFPSHFDAPGRPVFEAAFFEVPSIVCTNRPLPDTLIDGETGLAIPSRNPAELASAINYFYQNRQEVVRMGRRARELVSANCSPDSSAARIKDIYESLL